MQVEQNPQTPDEAGAVEIHIIPDEDNPLPLDPTAVRANPAVMWAMVMRFFTMGIGDVVKFGKHLLRVGIPMGFTLVLSASPLLRTVEGDIIIISIAVSVSLALNGLFLRHNHPRASNCMLLSASILLFLSFFALLGFFLPFYLKWIPLIACLFSLIPFAISVSVSARRR